MRSFLVVSMPLTIPPGATGVSTASVPLASHRSPARRTVRVVIEVSAQPGEASAEVRSFAACIASVLELDAADVPAPAMPIEDAKLTWRQWLAGRGLGLVPVAGAAAFTWPGPFIGRLRTADGALPAVVMFGVPPGVVWDPLGDATPAAPDVAEAYVIAALDVGERRERQAATAGRVEAILVARRVEGPMERLEETEAIAGRGLRGDRYADGVGTFSNPIATGGDLTLVDAEALETTILPSGDAVTPEQARRNLVTRGVDLDALIGRRFTVGGVRCIGRRRCEPCAHLERLAEPGILRGLVHRGGLRADIELGGTIARGDAIVVVD